MDDRRLPDAINVDRHETGEVRIQFVYDDGEPAIIHLDQPRLLALLAQLHAKNEGGTLSPISPSLLRQGQQIETVGQSWRRLPDRSLALTLYAIADGRQVTISCSIPPGSVADLKAAIGDND